MKSGVDDKKCIPDHHDPWILHPSPFTVMITLGGMRYFIICTGEKYRIR
jgi:hypothetical protein